MGMTETELGTVWHRIRRWAADRDIVEQSTPIQQLAKLTEELGELAAALVRMRDLDAKDAIGDCAVVLTIIADQLGMAIEDCVDCAYEEIKDRRGRMVDGVWVKAEDA
jgi:NTP pyrophosphatase (non-canonical NTP hydrolase)